MKTFTDDERNILMIGREVKNDINYRVKEDAFFVEYASYILDRPIRNEGTCMSTYSYCSTHCFYLHHISLLTNYYPKHKLDDTPLLCLFGYNVKFLLKLLKHFSFG